MNHNGPRDSQRSRLYHWERFLPDGSAMTLPECEELVALVCEVYGVRLPRVTDGRRRRAACWKVGPRHICLPRWARTPRTVLHECAHMLVDWFAKWGTHPVHGKEFAGCFVDLYLRFVDSGLTYQQVRNLARAGRIHAVPHPYLPACALGMRHKVWPVAEGFGRLPIFRPPTVVPKPDMAQWVIAGKVRLADDGRIRAQIAARELGRYGIMPVQTELMNVQGLRHVEDRLVAFQEPAYILRVHRRHIHKAHHIVEPILSMSIAYLRADYPSDFLPKS